MTALLTADEAARLVPGEQLVIVRAGEESFPLYQVYHAPQDWVALTGPCSTCCGTGWRYCFDTGERCPNPDCRDGRRIELLFADMPNRIADGTGIRAVGRGSIEVVPVGRPGDALPHLHWQPMASRWVLMGGDGSIRDTEFGRMNPDAAVPGRDFGIVIDCVEVAT